MNQREEMILGKKLTPHSIVYLMLVTITNQNLPQKYKSMSGLFYSCKILYIPALMIIVLVKNLGGEIADILQRKWPK